MPYQLTYSELLEKAQASLGINPNIYYMKKDLSLEDRLQISGINYVDNSSKVLSRVTFNDNVYTMLLLFRQQLDDREEFFTCGQNTNDPQAYHIYQILMFTDATPKSYELDVRKKRPGYILTFVDGREIGFAEIKPFDTPESLIEEDRARLGEHMKKALDNRIYLSKNTREFTTFGADIELYIMSYGNREYPLEKIKTMKLPTLDNQYHGMESTLEYLFGFMSLITESLPKLEEVDQPYIYYIDKPKLKPNVSYI